MARDKPVALVTGAGQGIGRGISLEMAKNGFDIAGMDIIFDSGNTQAGLFEVKERVEELESVFLPLQGDVSSIKDHEKILKLTLDKFGKIDVLVNNAGLAPEKRELKGRK